jgi:hypothetical protein
MPPVRSAKPLPIKCGTLPFRPPLPPQSVKGTTLGNRDRYRANQLIDALSQVGGESGPKAKLSRGKGGAVFGPEGQPLIRVLIRGKTCFVDPNTNQYYVARRDGTAQGPFALPREVQFSNSHFSNADVAQLERDVISLHIVRGGKSGGSAAYL